MSEQSRNPLNLRSLIAWIVIIIAIVEWFPFFLQVLLNFFNMNLRRMPAEELPLILAIVAAPFISILIGILRRWQPAFFEKLMPPLTAILLCTTAIVSWLAFSAYYQIYPIFTPDFRGELVPNSDLFGFLSYLSEAPKMMVYVTNGLIFYGLVPVLSYFIMDPGGDLSISRETNWGVMIAAAYLWLRPGSVVGVPLRFAIVGLLGLAVWVLFNKKPKSNEEISTSRPPSDWTSVGSHTFPRGSQAGIAMQLTIAITGPALLMNGLLYNAWVWVFLLISTILVEVITRKKWKILSRRRGLLVVGGLLGTQLLLLWAPANAALLAIEDWLQALMLFLLGFFPLVVREFGSRTKASSPRRTLLRQFWFFLVVIFAALLPLLASLLVPLTSLAAIILASATEGCFIIVYWKMQSQLLGGVIPPANKD